MGPEERDLASFLGRLQELCEEYNYTIYDAPDDVGIVVALCGDDIDDIDDIDSPDEGGHPVVLEVLAESLWVYPEGIEFSYKEQWCTVQDGRILVRDWRW